MTNLNSKSAICLFVGMLFMSIGLHAQDDFFEPDPYAKVRLGFTAPTGFYRQILIGFQSGVCTEGIDPGYDAINTFDLPCDMYFYCNNTELFIQGVGAFSEMNTYPLGVTLNVSGNISIALESVENLSSSQAIYIHDAHTGQYSNLKTGAFTAILDAGTYNERFSLRFFQQSTLGIGDSVAETSISYIQGEKALYLKSSALLSEDVEIHLYNLNGQRVNAWTITSAPKGEILVPVSGLSAGIYIVQLNSPGETVVKKIAIR